MPFFTYRFLNFCIGIPIKNIILFAAQFSCFWGPLRALRMRFHACLALMRILDEISCFLGAEFLMV
jgi:hypothetical protein